MGNGAFSEISTILKKRLRRICRLLKISVKIKISAHILGRENILRKAGLFLQVFYPILKCRLSRSVGRRAVARLFFSAVFACRRSLARIDFIALTNY